MPVALCTLTLAFRGRSLSDVGIVAGVAAAAIGLRSWRLDRR